MNATFDLTDQPGYMDCGPFLGAWSQKEGDKWQTQFPFLLEAVSCGTDMCLYIDESNPAVTGRKIAVLCNLKGLLVTSFGNRARMSPPLVLTDGEMERGIQVLREALEEVTEYNNVPGMVWTGPEYAGPASDGKHVVFWSRGSDNCRREGYLDSCVWACLADFQRQFDQRA